MMLKLPRMINILWIFIFQSIYGKSNFPAIPTYLRFVCEGKRRSKAKIQIYLFCKREKLFQLFNLNIISVKHEYGELFSNPNFRLSSASHSCVHTHTHAQGCFSKYNVSVCPTRYPQKRPGGEKKEDGNRMSELLI